MKFTPTRLPDVIVIEPQVFEDARGFFMETWEARKFAAGGISARFVQENHSSSRQWVLRGLHYQLRQPQGQLVRVTPGEVFDVAVDLRRSSPTVGRWVGEFLSEGNHRMMWIPAGFAHGFLVLSERVEFIYKCTDYYLPESERALLWSDPAIGIEWPLPSGITPIVSPKDEGASTLASAETYP
jgi:dTDP-4-dehydrorhamnose 3,5-epimerase